LQERPENGESIFKQLRKPDFSQLLTVNGNIEESQKIKKFDAFRLRNLLAANCLMQGIDRHW
jgi:hypothetical protein